VAPSQIQILVTEPEYRHPEIAAPCPLCIAGECYHQIRLALVDHLITDWPETVARTASAKVKGLPTLPTATPPRSPGATEFVPIGTIKSVFTRREFGQETAALTIGRISVFEKAGPQLS